MLRTYTPLPDRTESLISEIIDGGMCIHKALGNGFFEKTYRNAFCVELRARGIPFEMEKAFAVEYRGETVGVQRIDLVVEDVVIVEIKAVDSLAKVHEQQILSYLRATKIRAGILMNFGGAMLNRGLRRFVI